LDRAVRRILRVKLAFGLFEGTGQKSAALVNARQHQELARETAEAGMVLLKNQNSVLPLDLMKLKSLAIIGPNAARARLGGGGSSTVTPPYAVSPLDGIRKKCGAMLTVAYEPGCLGWGDITPVSEAALTAPDGKPGLSGEYFTNMNLAGIPQFVRTDPQIYFEWGQGGPGPDFPGDYFSVRWSGTLTAPKTGEIEFYLASDDGSRMYCNDQLVIDNWGDHGRQTRSGKVRLEQGRAYRIKIEYYERTGEALVLWGWNAFQDQLLAQAQAVAARSDAAVVFAGLNNQYEGEGVDRPSLALPSGQDDLIRAVTAVNPRTIVVLENGTPLDMRAWLGQVPAVLEAWYPGMEGGNAIANLLFGEVNPSGKLPVTFPQKLEDNPSFGHYPGDGAHVRYAEGLFIGYRHYDHQSIEPLFPFGHGLSYTTFAYSDLAVAPAQSKHGPWTVRLKVKNTGARAGKEVVQLYLGAPASALPRPPRELKGFQKVALAPGETQTVTFEITREAMSYYDVGEKTWQVDPGKYAVFAGSSSRDIRLRGELQLEP
jgi:beta-glucosidase